MNFLVRCHASCLSRGRSHHQHYQVRTVYDAVFSLKCPRDHGLDHAVERDKYLKPLLHLKNLIISEPSKSIPLSLITESKETLGIPFRPIDFIRKYPSIFQEFHPGSLKIHPHIKLTPEIISLSSDENLLYQSVSYKQDIAGRLLKLLMISRINKIPIFLLEMLKWELGLPLDYEKAIIPEFPDYFRVISGKNFDENEKVLELVWWNDEFAVSEMGKKGAKHGKIEFPLQFSKEFEMDKKYKNWLNEWQKLPYVSPYENAMHLATKTDESDKWSVAVLHEVLSLFVGKRVERESLLFLGEYLGLRSRFKGALLQHPGIFYVSSKIGTHTVVLKEAYKRGMLIERHPLMDMRSKYIMLMNVVKDENKAKSGQQKTGIDVNKSEGEELEDVEGEEEENDEIYDSSDDDETDDQMEALQGENGTKRERFLRKGTDFEGRNTRRSVTRRTRGRDEEENLFESSSRFSRRSNAQGGDSSIRRRTTKKSDFSGNRTNRRGTEENVSNKTSRLSRRTNVQGVDSGEDHDEMYDSSDDDENVDQMDALQVENGTKRGRFQRKGAEFEERNTRRSATWRTSGRREEDVSRSSSWYSRRSNVRGGDSNIHGRTTKKSDFSGYRTNGRGTVENVSKNSSRFSRRTNVRGGDSDIPRRTGKKSDYSGYGARSKTGNYVNDDRMEAFQGEENVTRRGIFKRKGAEFEKRSTGRSVARRTNGRGAEGNMSEGSPRFSRRTDGQGGDLNIPRRSRKNSDFSGYRARSKTGKTPMY